MRILIAHSAHVFNKPRVTVAGVVIDGILKLGVSRCNENDIYFRKGGNDKATGRALIGSKNRTSERSKSREIQRDLVRKGLYAEFPVTDPEAPVVPQFLEIANTIIAQHGGVVKQRKDNVASNNEEDHAVSQHN